VAPPMAKDQPSLRLLKQGILLECRVHLGLEIDYKEAAADLLKVVQSIKPNNIAALIGLFHYAMALTEGLSKSILVDPLSISKISLTCARVCRVLKESKASYISRSLRTFYKGFIFILAKRNDKALLQWRKVLTVKARNPTLAIKALILRITSKFSDAILESRSAKMDAKKIYRELGALYEYEKLQ
jgi:hypothetical protein